MKKIETLAQLRLERKKLYIRKELLEDEIKLDFEEFRESLRPVNMLKELLHREKDPNKVPQPVAPTVLNIGSTMLDLVLGKMFLRKSSLVKKLIASYVVRAVGPSLISKAAPVVSNLITKFQHQLSDKSRHNGIYEQSTASDVY